MATALHTARPYGDNMLQMSYAVDSSELTAAATTQTIALGTLPAGAQVAMAYLDLVAPFTDAGSISAVGLEVGSAGDPDALIVSQELMSGASRRAPWRSRPSSPRPARTSAMAPLRTWTPGPSPSTSTT